MSQAFGTKAETLALLRGRGFAIPPLYYFDVSQWQREPHGVLDAIMRQFPEGPLAIRSSARSEDTHTTSQAGAFHSVLHVSCEREALHEAVAMVTDRFRDHADQVLVQPMVHNVHMAGVIMTRVLDDGSPYYVFNYDDVSGRTDTVTGGHCATKMVHVYKGVETDDFDSPRLREALRLARMLESVFGDIPLDIEFAVDAAGQAWLLQVRPICSSRHWKARAAAGVSERIRHVEEFVREGMRPRPGFYGKHTMYGVMPDWNPAEIIGLVPRPLAFSLYRAIITRTVWSQARARMGYHATPTADLMLSLAGRPYIDVRASFNSFLPAGVPPSLAEKLVNAWLDRLEAHPELHDKVEFDIVPTVLDFDTEAVLHSRYPQMLDEHETTVYVQALRSLTNAALDKNSTLAWALEEAEALLAAPLPDIDAFGVERADFAVQLPALLEDCRQRGTLPFAVAARHAFMAESLLRSAVRCGAMTQERLEAFKRSVSTVSGELSRDFAEACADEAARSGFLSRYGHLRPGTYDILSPSYTRRTNLFDVAVEPAVPSAALGAVSQFSLSRNEDAALQSLLCSSGLATTPQGLLDYARRAIAGREYAKFVFTRHLSHILELLAAWGKTLGLTRAQMAMLPVEAVLDTLFAPLPCEARAHFLSIIRRQQHMYDLASSFKLSQLIRSPRDVYIAPVHRALPNFITAHRVEAPVTCLAPEEERDDLAGTLVCIESADPGYDWIFTRGIAGLITRFGGANSHMAIRCAEYGLPAAIGCGTLLFERAAAAPRCILDCGGKVLCPVSEEVALV